MVGKYLKIQIYGNTRRRQNRGLHLIHERQIILAKAITHIIDYQLLKLKKSILLRQSYFVTIFFQVYLSLHF